MSEAIVITPVKDSLETIKRTIETVSNANGKYEYIVFNDFSQPETKKYLENAKEKFNFQLVNLEEVTSSPSPNYKLVLEMAQQKALQKEKPLIIVESDVVVQKDTLQQLVQLSNKYTKTGLAGAITVDEKGNYNFPYTFEKKKSSEVIDTSHSLSFCCTLISVELLKEFDFRLLSQKKDWFDVFISRQSKKLGYSNYLAKGLEVLHLPHSSRPWKNLKYSNPVLYYLKKIVNQRDRI